MKELLIEFLGNILNEARVKAVKVDPNGERVVYFGSPKKAQAAIAAGTHRPYIDTDKNLPSTKSPNKMGSMGKDPAADQASQIEKDLRDPAKLAAMKGDVPTSPMQQKEPTSPTPIDSSSVPSLSNKAREAGLAQLHNDFVDILGTGDTSAITKFMETHQIRYDTRKKTFYSMKTSGRDEKKIFGDGKDKDGKETARGKAQRELHEKLVDAGVVIGDRNSNDPLKPSAIVPQESRRPFTGKRIDDDTLEFEGKQYMRIPHGQFGNHITRQVGDWRKNFIRDAGRAPTDAEIKEATTRIVVITDATNKRFGVLEQLLTQSKKNPSPHEVAIFEGQDGAIQCIGFLKESLLKQVPNDQSFSQDLDTALKAVEGATDEEQFITSLNSLFRLLENNSNCKESIPAIAESMSVILELKRGRQVIVPMSDNFRTADLISLSTSGEVDPTTASLEELEKQVRVIYSSISVKLEEGAASSFTSKIAMSVFQPNHKEVTHTLLDLTSGYRSLFDEGKRTEKEGQVTQHIKDNLVAIRKYYNLPPNMQSQQVINILKAGGVVCKDCTTVGRNAPDYMTRPDVDQTAYGWYHAMVFSAEAIYNSTVVGQGFGNQYWGGRRGFTEIDGIRQQSKQRAEPNKSQRGRGAAQRPDAVVSHNARSTQEDLRTGDPCRNDPKCKKPTPGN